MHIVMYVCKCVGVRVCANKLTVRQAYISDTLQSHDRYHLLISHVAIIHAEGHTAKEGKTEQIAQQ
jgi:hypothetical protein